MIKNKITVVPVMPVKMYQTKSKHIMFRCRCRFLLQTFLFEMFLD